VSRYWLLQVTEANHVENEFFTLGGAGFLTKRERTANIATISRDLGDHVCDESDRCYMLDVLDHRDGFSLEDEFEISEATAHVLLGEPDFEPTRQRERELIAAAVAS
jgi:hypothetical protein